jgi:methionine-rich copper-binding protein CopC
MLISKKLLIRSFLLWLAITITSVTTAATMLDEPQTSSGISLSPARIELEMQPGTETTVVVNIDYHSTVKDSQPVRIVASLNDWTIARNGEVQFQRANTLPNSASSWAIYSPAETMVTPGQVHAIRVTISVPKDASTGDHLTSLIIEQRPDTLKLNQNLRQMVVRYRMAAVFYIKVPKLIRRGSLDGLQAEATAAGIIVTPSLSNKGNSVIRPITSLKLVDSSGTSIAELPQKESLPLLGGSELAQPITLEKTLAPGSYTVRYRVDFQDGNTPTEGITDLIVRETTTASRSNGTPARP